MSKFATQIAVVGVSLFMLHGPGVSVPQDVEQLPDTNIWQMTMGPDAGARSATQSVPALPPEWVASTGQPAGARSEEEAEYQAERRACEALASDARNHCLEYAKLRYGRWNPLETRRIR